MLKALNRLFRGAPDSVTLSGDHPRNRTFTKVKLAKFEKCGEAKAEIHFRYLTRFRRGVAARKGDRSVVATIVAAPNQVGRAPFGGPFCSGCFRPQIFTAIQGRLFRIFSVYRLRLGALDALSH